jgi:hypothetical protein
MVKKIIDEHGGRIDLQNRAGANGAKISILLLKLAYVDEPTVKLARRVTDKIKVGEN